jgi:hypothetical protein
MGVRTNQMRAARLHIDWSTRVLASALLLIALSVAHLMQSFAQGLPARFGMIVPEAALIFAAAYAAHIVFILLAAAENASGFIGNLIFGVLWLVMVGAIHLALPAYGAGLLARTLEAAVIFVAMLLGISSLMAWRAASDPRPT